MTEKPRETQAELHVVELKEKVNNSSLMKQPLSIGLMESLIRLLSSTTPGVKPISDQCQKNARNHIDIGA